MEWRFIVLVTIDIVKLDIKSMQLDPFLRCCKVLQYI